MNPPIITLTTDFGDGPFVGLMKGVILGICPRARLVDLSHAVPPQDVRAGALVIEQALSVFASGTVHLGVVDPGVGGARRGICVCALGSFFVGPDNGLFTAALEADPRARVFHLTNAELFRHPVSSTFHGRDVFAPVAAHLACGLEPERLGPAVADPVRLDWPRPRREGGVLYGVVLGADRFGNLDTNLSRAVVEEFLQGRPGRVSLAGMELGGVAPSYDAVPRGQPVAVYNSQERLELALNQGDLCRHLGLEASRVFGLPVRVYRA